MAQQNYDKFLVVKNEDIEKYLGEDDKELLNDLLDKIEISRERDGKNTDNTYYVVNTDEPYADEVLQVILNGEDEKED